MDWLDECNRIDHRLHDLGIPDDIRMRAIAEIMTIMAQAEKRWLARERRCSILSATVESVREIGTQATAERFGVTDRAIRKRVCCAFGTERG